jgi:hypothetical protein
LGSWLPEALAEMRKNDPEGYAAAFGSTTAPPAIAAPQPAVVTKWQPYGQQADGERTWVAKGDGAPALKLRLLDPAGRSAAEIRKSWQDGTLQLDPDATGSWYFARDTMFHGRMVPAGSIVTAVPA